MTPATVVIASVTALDVAAARRLADYGDLDDAGVARALEQVHMQRWGRRDVPGHLRRIDALAAVVIFNEQPRLLVSVESTDERALLAALFEAWPRAATEIVDWDGANRSLLIARAIAHELPLPPAFEQAVSCVLADHAAPVAADHPLPVEQIEAETLQLLAGWQPPTADDEPALAERATARYRLWLRWQYCRGGVDAGTRACFEARLNEQRPDSLG